VEFDGFTIGLLVLRDDAPQLTPAEEDALQDAHLSYLTDLHEAGQLFAAGPLRDHEGFYRGLSIYSVGVDEARALADADPAVQAGKFRVIVLPWMVPAGAVNFELAARFPRSVAEATAD
jgi:uncharacterized protein YciI